MVHKYLLEHYCAYGEIIDISVSLTGGHGMVLAQPDYDYKSSDLINDFVVCLEIGRKRFCKFT